MQSSSNKLDEKSNRFLLSKLSMLHFILLCDLTFGVMSGCTKSFIQHKSSSSGTEIRPSPTGNFSSNILLDSPIRKVDFHNFTYPWHEDLIDSASPGNKTFTLRNSEILETRDKKGRVDKMGVSWVGTIYADATSDGKEDAIVILSLLTGGSTLPNCIYVYTWDRGHPQLLWSYATGDRADGGLRRIYTEEGKLVLELYSPIDKKADCCPQFFKRTHYIWRGRHFLQVGKEELLPNPEGHASLILPK